MKNKTTFNNLTGIKTIKAMYDSEGVMIKGSEIEVVILYNSTVISEQEVMELINTGKIEQSDKVIVVPRYIAQNLKDRKEE